MAIGLGAVVQSGRCAQAAAGFVVPRVQASPCCYCVAFTLVPLVLSAAAAFFPVRLRRRRTARALRALGRTRCVAVCPPRARLEVEPAPS